jgi:hypothetical protein
MRSVSSANANVDVSEWNTAHTQRSKSSGGGDSIHRNDRSGGREPVEARGPVAVPAIPRQTRDRSERGLV